MKLKTVNKLKRSVSAVSAVAMAVSVLPAVNIYAVTGTTHYDLDGYSIDYTVTNEWIGHQTVAVKLTNTSDEPILNWALGYDAHGDIENIWNGNVSSKDDNGYIIKNAGYNYEIAPGSSVSYGYTLSGIDLSVPDSFEVLSKRVDKTNGYVVNYNKLSDWGQGFQGEIVVLNTSSEPLEAWTVGFDSSFEINSLWGGRIISHEDSHYEIAAESWTNPIAPDSQVTIGFIGASNGDASISNKSLSTVVTGRNSDNTEKPELSVSASGEYVDGSVELAWDSTANNGVYEVFYSTDNVEYASVGTTKKKTFTFTPDSDVNGDVYFKIKQTAKDGRIAESSVVVVNIPAPVIKITPELSVTAEYDTETGYINAAWETTVSDGSFKVVVSLGEEEISSCDIKDTNSFSFKPEKSGEYLIKVTQTTETGMTATRSVSVNAVVSENTEPDPEINWEDETDTDNDGLPDVYELNYFNTDPNKADTDGDELPDGYEVMNLGTDPTKADSDGNGINDGDEDADKDNLTNKEEYTLGTSPIEKDTDQDGLSDYDEVYSYGTDPLKYDTDGDSISDGDEIVLGLDPLNPTTNGIPDSKHTFIQHIGAESDVFARVNTAENPFKVSIDIECAGIAENNLYSKESGYSNAISNPAILGIAPEFEYTEGLDVKDVVINFDIESVYTSNVDGSYASVNSEFAGIKRLNVFKFFEDTNILLPIETFHDVENNRVYTHVDELGTYCLMDMEKWFASLDVKADEFKTGSTSMDTLSEISSSRTMTMNKLSCIKSNSEDKEENQVIDVVFLMYVYKTYSSIVKDELSVAIDKIYQKYDNVHIHFVKGNSSNTISYPAVYMVNGKGYAENCEEAKSTLERITFADEKAGNLIRGINKLNELEYANNSSKYVFLIDALMAPKTVSSYSTLDALKYNNLEFYTICDIVNDNISAYNSLADDNAHNNIVIFADYISDKIKAKENTYHIISAVGWDEVTLNSSLQQNYEWYQAGTHYNESMDTDHDGLADYEEIKFKRDNGVSLVNDTDPTNVKLFNFAEVIELSADRHNYDYDTDKLFYVVNGLERLCKNLGYDTKYPISMLNFGILPINSNPNCSDGDEDGIIDKEDYSPLSYCINDDFIVYLNDLEIQTELYFENKGITKNNKDLARYIFTYIKGAKLDANGERLYCKGYWPTASGNVEEEYFSYIDKHSMFNEYVSKHYNGDTVFISNSINSKKIDLLHMSATITAIMYETSYKDAKDLDKDGFSFKNFIGGPVANQFTSEIYIDALSGWGGDLQQLMVDAKRFCYVNSQPDNIEMYKQYIKDNLGADNLESRFSYSDILSDIDSELISSILLCDKAGICTTVRNYYCWNDSDCNRFDRYFVYYDQLFVRVITNTYYPSDIVVTLPGINSFKSSFVTPIFKRNDSYEVDGVTKHMEIEFTKEQEDFACLWFNTYIYEHTSHYPN